ncbi:MAG: GlsB/YeaQ/YmgE family stress response membrane protein [Candidatus Paceibacterota bacterium]
MSILAWVILGGIAGWIGSILMSTNESQGIIMNIVIGILGAFVGGFLFSFIGGDGITGFNFYSLFVAIIGSVTFIWLARVLKTSQ